VFGPNGPFGDEGVFGPERGRRDRDRRRDDRDRRREDKERRKGGHGPGQRMTGWVE
jgi:hypothetical protein